MDSSIPLASQLHILSLFGPASGSTPLSSNSVLTNGNGTSGPSNGELEEPQEVVTAMRESPYEALRSVVHNVMAPWFEAYVNSKNDKEKVVGNVKGKDGDAKMGEYSNARAKGRLS